jgi:purine-binding chemotaxis protein CheW
MGQSDYQSWRVTDEHLNRSLQPVLNSRIMQLQHIVPGARTREVAQIQEQPEDRRDLLELVTFRLRGEVYAVEARYVYEIMQLPQITIVPCSPEYLQGVINLRGEILAVFDFNRLFGLGRSTIEETSRLIVLGESHPEFAFVADAVEEVKAVYTSEINLPTAPFASIRREIVRGVTADALVMLDGRELLADERLVIEQRDDV